MSETSGEVERLLNQGLTFRKIASQMGISREQVALVWVKGRPGRVLVQEFHEIDHITR